MDRSPTIPIRIAQVIGVTTAGIYSGVVFAQYIRLVPSYLSQPAKPAVAKWYNMHIFSKQNLAPAALVGIFSNLFLTIRYFSMPSSMVVVGDWVFDKWKAYALATTCMAAFIPWTAKVMLPINLVLEDYHAGKATIGDGEAKALLGEWRRKSVVRAWPVGISAIIGLFAASS